MRLKIHTVHGMVFDGQVEKVELPSKVGMLCILPQHNPLTAMVIPGIVRFVPEEKKGSEFLSDTEFLFEDEKIAMAVGEGFMYTDGQAVVLFVASATVSPKTDQQVLEEMKTDLEKQIADIKASGNQEEIERAYLNLQKLTADLQLLRIKERKSGKKAG
ncbi:MAG: hypothetical protein DLD55_04705 [candidate division SR1 bacterium]|nr:MAG: hypothetical protein DLD55_04705 [candidate division SR1 bacterium]